MLVKNIRNHNSRHTFKGTKLRFKPQEVKEVSSDWDGLKYSDMFVEVTKEDIVHIESAENTDLSKYFRENDRKKSVTEETIIIETPKVKVKRKYRKKKDKTKRE